MPKERKEIDQKYKWNIEAMYEDKSMAEKDIEECVKMAKDYEKYCGHLGDSAKTFLSALKDSEAISRKAEKAFCYASMKKDEDSRVNEYQALVDKVESAGARMSASMSFFGPEFKAIPEETLAKWLKEEPELKIYAHSIEEMLREKAHILSDAEEKLLASLSEIFGATSEAFSMLSDVDFKFGSIKNEKGEDVEVTHGTYIGLMQNKDRRVRREAYEHMYNKYKEFQTTLATFYSYSVKEDVVGARIRKYPSAKEEALYSDNIPVDVYDNLIKVVNEHLPALHRYIDIRKKLLGVDDLKMYDLYVPIMERPEESFTYEESQEIIFKALAPLGEEYIAGLKQGFEQHWQDVYENTGKRSGAYSSGCYDSYPYVLLNFDGKLEDVFTIAHEMGHSMHSQYTRKNQPFVYGDYSIFAAEVASTVNESLLMRYLINNAKDKTEKAYLINMYLEQFRTTLFRQTQFAEFEAEAHRMAEEGEALTPSVLAELYAGINSKYYGPSVNYDDFISYEWSRIPHFYSAFYVFQYATGYSAATAISSRILEKGKSAADEYISFLKCGSSDYPIETLKKAGVDMSSTIPVEAAMKRFEELLDELESLI